MRDHYPDEWADAVALEAAIRRGGARALPLRGETFLHSSRVPLAVALIDQVTSAEWKQRQGNLLDYLADPAEDGDPDGCSPYRPSVPHDDPTAAADRPAPHRHERGATR
ncbi:MAG TPA: hypothetical protein VFC19_38705 [Candidatus Limnocylindrales bacterium]|nr:hypothetical protein [Candidatus Limnocylindrales bacterium]